MGELFTKMTMNIKEASIVCYSKIYQISSDLLKHTKHRPTDIDIAEENNIYQMLTQQRPVSNWENYGFCA